MENQRLPIGRITENKQPAGRFTDSELDEMKRAVARRLEEAFQTKNYHYIAGILDCSPAAIKQYLDAKRFPAPDILIKFALVTDYSIHWLMTGEGEMLAPMNVAFRNVFTEDEFAEITQNAKTRGRGIKEEIRALVVTSLDFIRRYKNPD